MFEVGTDRCLLSLSGSVWDSPLAADVFAVVGHRLESALGASSCDPALCFFDSDVLILKRCLTTGLKSFFLV